MSTEPNYPASFYAKLFNITERRIQQLAKDGIIPKAARGKYPLIGAIKAYVKYLQDRALGSEVTPGDLQVERIRLTKANADKVELEVALLEGSVILAETVEAVQSRMISTFRARCLSIPTKVAPRLTMTNDLAIIEVEVRDAIYDALSELSEFRTADYGIGTIPGSSENIITASEIDSERMG